MIHLEYPFWVWGVFFGVVLSALFIDIGVVNRRTHAPTKKETFAWSVIWVSLALLFCGFIFSQFGSFKAKEFLTGYLIELSLSVDNLFVFLLIFKYFKVPKKYQHRALFWGVLMALIMRLAMIFLGASIVEQFHWTLYVAGAFLIYTGIKLFGDDEMFEPHESWMVRFTSRFIRISKHYEGEKFFIRVNGKLTGTILLLVLIVINVADLVFAVDSIPAILGITTDRFIVYTSNIFAILGLRTFYFLLSALADRFRYLKYGLAFILTFIGIKMLLPLLAEGLLKLTGDGQQSSIALFLERFQQNEYEQTVINISLAVVVIAIALSIIASALIPARDPDPEEEDESEE